MALQRTYFGLQSPKELLSLFTFYLFTVVRKYEENEWVNPFLDRVC